MLCLPPGRIVTGCHARQLWGLFLHAGVQLPFLLYNCTGWIQQSEEQKDLKGPKMRKEATVLLYQTLKTGEKSDD